MKTFRLFSMAALALMMAACSSNEDMIQQPAQPQSTKMHFTATIEAPNSDAITRTTATLDKDANQKDIIKMAWKVGDAIALVHSNGVDLAEVTAVDLTTGAATIECLTIPTDGEAVTLVYPYGMVYGVEASSPWDYTPATYRYNSYDSYCNGTFESIFPSLDWREGKSTFSVNGNNVTLSSRVKMASNIAIWKLTLQDNTSAPLTATNVSIKIDSPTETHLAAYANNNSGLSEYYMCLIPAQMPAGDLVIEATVGSDTYKYTKAGGVSLTAGKFYQSTVTLTKPATGHALSASAVGEVVGTDGLAYAVADKDNLPTGVSAAGMVAYKNGSNGLVIALSDDGTMDWSTANGATTGAAAHTPAVTGQTWKLPSQAEWQQMFSANGGSQSSYTGLNTALAAAGGDSSKLQDGDDYWSSTETEINGEQAFAMLLLSYNGSVISISAAKVDNPNPVRACFAF